jgi:hypothetical protein
MLTAAIHIIRNILLVETNPKSLKGWRDHVVNQGVDGRIILK